MAIMKPIVPKKQKLDITAEINAALTKTLKTGQTYFKQTTRTWQTDVRFDIDGPTDGVGTVGTDNDIYGYVTRGTAPHLITPHGRFLVWESGNYRAKSQPGVLGSRRGGNRPTGGVGQAIFARKVRHPGTKARGFEEAVAKRLQPVLENNVTAAILKVIG